MLGHVGRVELGESKRRLAQFAVFLLRMRQPLHQAVLVDIFDTATAFTGEEERLGAGGFASADSASIEIQKGIVGPRVAGGYHVVPDIGSRGRVLMGVINSPEPDRAVIHGVVVDGSMDWQVSDGRMGIDRYLSVWTFVRHALGAMVSILRP